MSTETISRENFYAQHRRICILETQATTIMGKKFCANARKCSHRQANAIKFTEKDFKGLRFAECNHSQKEERYSVFCPVMIARIEEEPA